MSLPARGTFLNNRKHLRGRIEIMADILSIATTPVRKTMLMFGSNTAYPQLVQYLARMQQARLIEETQVDGLVMYRTTAKGREFLEEFAIMCKLINLDVMAR